MDFSAQELLFFAARPKAQEIYLVIRDKILGLSGVTLSVHKMQISFYARRAFACVWHPPVKRLGEEAMMLSFYLPWPLESPRLFGRAEAKPGRFTCHIVVTEAAQLDPELLGWLEQAYMYACRA